MAVLRNLEEIIANEPPRKKYMVGTTTTFDQFKILLHSGENPRLESIRRIYYGNEIVN